MALAKLLKMFKQKSKILSWLGTAKVVLKLKVQGHSDGARGSGTEQRGPGEPPRSQGRVSVGTGASPQEKNVVGVWCGRRG